jgi:hypothetical protein
MLVRPVPLSEVRTHYVLASVSLQKKDQAGPVWAQPAYVDTDEI